VPKMPNRTAERRGPRPALVNGSSHGSGQQFVRGAVQRSKCGPWIPRFVWIHFLGRSNRIRTSRLLVNRRETPEKLVAGWENDRETVPVNRWGPDGEGSENARIVSQIQSPKACSQSTSASFGVRAEYAVKRWAEKISIKITDSSRRIEPTPWLKAG
jgi:hypothetical protein